LADDGDTVAKPGDVVASEADEMETRGDAVSGGGWIAFHLSCWDEKPQVS